MRHSEEKIFEIISKNSEYEFGKLIEENNDPEISLALSYLRSNCVEWIPISKEDHVLECGAEYGAISGMLADKARHLTVFEPSIHKSKVIRERMKGRATNIRILSSLDDFQIQSKDQKFNLIFLIGTLERASVFFDSPRPAESLLNFLKNYLAEDGKIIVASSNKFGLKYWSGCVEDSSRRLFEGIEGFNNFPEFSSFTKDGFIQLAESTGYKIVDTHYLYPDYKITLSVFSDEYLPRPATLYANQFTWEGERAELFSERLAWDNIIREKLFPIFSNSFLFILQLAKTPIQNDYPCRQIFIKYSNLRSSRFQIRTDIIKRKDGHQMVEKRSLTGAAYDHLMNIHQSYSKILPYYSKKGISINKCHKKGDVLEFEFIHGNTFSEYLLDLILLGDYPKFYEEIIAFFTHIKIGECEIFQVTPEFSEVFGDVSFSNNLLAASVGNIDLNFDNIFLKNGTYHIIDYEWMFDFPIPLNYIIHGCLSIFFNHLVQVGRKLAETRQKIYLALEISDEEVIQYTNMWHSFDRYMMGENCFGLRNLQLKRIKKLVPNPTT